MSEAVDLCVVGKTFSKSKIIKKNYTNIKTKQLRSRDDSFILKCILIFYKGLHYKRLHFKEVRSTLLRAHFHLRHINTKVISFKKCVNLILILLIGAASVFS